MFGSVQFNRSVVSNSATPWTAAHQASLSITNSQSLLKLMSINSVMPYNHLILCHSFLFLPSILPSESVLHIRSPNIGVIVSASVLPMNIQDLFPLRLTGWTSLQSKGLSRVFSNTIVQKHQFLVFSSLYGPTLTSIHDYWKNHSVFNTTELYT